MDPNLGDAVNAVLAMQAVYDDRYAIRPNDSIPVDVGSAISQIGVGVGAEPAFPMSLPLVEVGSDLAQLGGYDPSSHHQTHDAHHHQLEVELVAAEAEAARQRTRLIEEEDENDFGLDPMDHGGHEVEVVHDHQQHGHRVGGDGGEGSDLLPSSFYADSLSLPRAQLEGDEPAHGHGAVYEGEIVHHQPLQQQHHSGQQQRAAAGGGQYGVQAHGFQSQQQQQQQQQHQLHPDLLAAAIAVDDDPSGTRSSAQSRNQTLLDSSAVNVGNGVGEGGGGGDGRPAKRVRRSKVDGEADSGGMMVDLEDDGGEENFGRSASPADGPTSAPSSKTRRTSAAGGKPVSSSSAPKSIHGSRPTLERKIAHKVAEQHRRAMIRTGYESLYAVIPALAEAELQEGKVRGGSGPGGGGAVGGKRRDRLRAQVKGENEEEAAARAAQATADSALRKRGPKKGSKRLRKPTAEEQEEIDRLEEEEERERSRLIQSQLEHEQQQQQQYGIVDESGQQQGPRSTSAGQQFNTDLTLLDNPSGEAYPLHIEHDSDSRSRSPSIRGGGKAAYPAKPTKEIAMVRNTAHEIVDGRQGPRSETVVLQTTIDYLREQQRVRISHLARLQTLRALAYVKFSSSQHEELGLGPRWVEADEDVIVPSTEGMTSKGGRPNAGRRKAGDDEDEGETGAATSTKRGAGAKGKGKGRGRKKAAAEEDEGGDTSIQQELQQQQEDLDLALLEQQQQQPRSGIVASNTFHVGDGPASALRTSNEATDAHDPALNNFAATVDSDNVASSANPADVDMEISQRVQRDQSGGGAGGEDSNMDLFEPAVRRVWVNWEDDWQGAKAVESAMGGA